DSFEREVISPFLTPFPYLLVSVQNENMHESAITLSCFFLMPIAIMAGYDYHSHFRSSPQ
ncbi:hypothetical protein AB4486_26985, partial [Vibrio sp. 10N.222.55.C6]|uniref:hypothetical protein n=1 Tax=Vibrio sp. 10N.222.55.C6 TaxID=3229649 RepID=UPI00354DD9F5